MLRGWSVLNHAWGISPKVAGKARHPSNELDVGDVEGIQVVIWVAISVVLGDVGDLESAGERL